MGPSVVLAGVIFGGAVLFTVFATDLLRDRQNRRVGSVGQWADLRVTQTQLIVGRGRNAARLPLAGLRAQTAETPAVPGNRGGARVHLTITGAGTDIRRSEPYSYGSSTGSAAFSILLNHLAADCAAAGHRAGDGAVVVSPMPLRRGAEQVNQPTALQSTGRRASMRDRLRHNEPGGRTPCGSGDDRSRRRSRGLATGVHLRASAQSWPRRPSIAGMPGPANAINRNAKQYRTASSPPLSMGNSALG